jgi:hypothetical protein
MKYLAFRSKLVSRNPQFYICRNPNRRGMLAPRPIESAIDRESSVNGFQLANGPNPPPRARDAVSLGFKGESEWEFENRNCKQEAL